MLIVTIMGYMDGKWIPVIMMIVISIILGIVNALIKDVLDGGVDHMVIATYRLALATAFLAPVAFFLERYATYFISSFSISILYLFFLI